MHGSGTAARGDRRRRALRWISLSVLGVLVGLGLADLRPRTARAAQPVDRPLSKMESDRFIDRVIDGERVAIMLGNVFIDRDTLTAASDTAYYYREQEVFEFLGNAHFTRNGAILDCRRALYDRNYGNGDFFGDVRLVDGEVIGTGAKAESREGGRFMRLIGDALLVSPDYTVRADTITRDRLNGVGEAFGHVRIMEPGSKNLVTGDHAIFQGQGDEEVAEVDRNPVLTSRENDGGILTGTAGLMRFYRAEDKVVMVDSVRIQKGQTLALADTAVAYGQEKMVLRGTPSVSMGGTSTLFGEEIEFEYVDGQLERVILDGSARMEDAAPDSLAQAVRGVPEMDILEGDSISVEFDNEEISRSVVVGRGHSIYTPLDLEEEIATNDVNGDTIIIDFVQGQVGRVRVIGNMEGTYRFARMQAMREMLGKSKRLVDMLARSEDDSSAFADSLIALGVDSSRVAIADSLIMQYADSLAMDAGLPALSTLIPAGQSNAAGMDSLMTAALDSLAAAGYDTSQSALDFLANAEDVKYSGGLLDFRMRDQEIDIQRNGVLTFGSMKLTADHIKLNTGTRELYADGDPLVEDSETIAGRRLGYDFGNKTGAVADGVTTFDNYYYVGDEIRRFPDTTLKICGGTMTSCDLAEPHYHFWADKMKMRMDDKVVAKPIVLRVGHMPVFALPFYFKSLKDGRQSGILFPSFDFGWSSREGRYIRDFGYYWATNEYLDFIFEGDYNERREFGYRISNRYVKRYAFNGGVDYSAKKGLGDNNVDEWQFRWNHNQPTLFDDYKFRSDVKMASKSLSSNDLTSSGGRDVVSGELKSTVYVNRSFDFMTASVNASRTERVNNEDPDDPSSNNVLYNMTLPSLSLSFKSRNLKAPLRGAEQGNFLGNLARNTTFGQGYKINSTYAGYELTKNSTTQASGNWNLDLRLPPVGPLTLSFGTSANHSWTRNANKGSEYVADTDTTWHYEAFDTVEETRNTGLSFSTGLSGAVYGLIPLQVGRMQAVRHTLRSSASWNLRPGLSSGQIHSTSVGLSMSNRFDVKYLSGAVDSTLTEKKLDGVIDWSLNTAYSPKNPAGQRWSNISSGLTIKPGQHQALRLKVSNTINPVNLALIRTSFTYGLNFSGKLDVGEVAAEPEPNRREELDRLGLDPTAADSTGLRDDLAFGDQGYEDNPEEFFDGEESSFQDFYNKPGRETGPNAKDPTEGGRIIPFRANASMSYSYDNISQKKRASANFSVSANITAKWDFRYQGSFDLVTASPVQQRYSLKRDLHCWSLEFNRTISAVNSEFGFRIYLKSIPALKFTRGVEDGMGSLGGGLY